MTVVGVFPETFMVLVLLKLLWLAVLSFIPFSLSALLPLESPSLLMVVETVLQFQNFRLVLLEVFFVSIIVHDLYVAMIS